MLLHSEIYSREFPLTRSVIYLNHAAVSPLPLRVRNAVTGFLDDRHLFGGEHFEQWLSAIEHARRATARLLGAEAEEIAFVKNTSEGISTFASGLEWQRGDEVVSIQGEFPANYYPWKLLERKGVRLRLAQPSDGCVSLDLIERSITTSTRVVAVSFVQFLSGYRLDLERLGRLCAERHVLLFVDAIQGLGAFPVDVKKAQIAGLSADAHKWLLGPEGCGVLFVRRDLLDRVQPLTVGWTNFEGWLDFTGREPAWRQDAGRFECGTLNVSGIYGLGAALSLIEEAGVEAIAGRILELTTRLREGLQARGYRLFGPTAPENCSGIVSFYPRQAGADEVAEQLREERVIVSARKGLMRISPHFYNTHEEIDQVLEMLP